MMPVKNFFLKIVFFLPVALILVSVNYFIDPANIFAGKKLYQETSQILLQGKNIANLSNFDERLLKKHYISGLKQKKDIVVLGSSRVMLINSENFPGYSFFNTGVSSATIEDDLALYWMYRKKGLIPKMVILSIDPWLFNKYNSNRAFQSIQDDYEESLRYIGIEKEKEKTVPTENFFSSKYFELISPQYFQTSLYFFIENVREGKSTQKTYYATSDNISDEMIRRADGSISYDLKYRSVSPLEVQAAVTSFFENKGSMLEDYKEFDPLLKDQFDKFIQLLKKDQVKVVFYLAPYHPMAYKNLINSDKYRIIVNVERFFRDYAKENNIEIFGSYNPDECGLEESDFYDAMHEKDQSINNIFKKNILHIP